MKMENQEKIIEAIINLDIQVPGLEDHLIYAIEDYFFQQNWELDNDDIGE